MSSSESQSKKQTIILSFQDVLNKYRKYSFSERDKGARFEKLMQVFLKTYPVYDGKFKQIWLWNEFPLKNDFSGKDTGIDLVAQTREGDFWAIQCKCYAENTYIDKPEVDSFLATSSKTFRDEQLKTIKFATRLWISTTNNWGSEAENSIKNQDPIVVRLSLSDLEEAKVNWEELENGISGHKARKEKHTIKNHQQEALEKFHEHFKNADRGKLIMACGTGKTFTALKIAEKETAEKGLILFLIPSIALVGQTLKEWSEESNNPINAICICSDSQVSKKKSSQDDTDVYSIEDLSLPASTDIKNIIHQFDYIKTSKKEGMTVVFSTYQSIDVIAKVQQRLKFIFDLIICDEAHRTTGVILKDEEEKVFTKVHDNNFIKSKKRLYMTATPRLYDENSKSKAKEEEAILCSMDDESIYGQEVYRIGFGEAVEKRLLSDYKVLVLTLREDQIPKALQNAISDNNQEINTDDASKLIGCINALSKRMLIDAELLKNSDPNPMHKAVAFCQNIKISKKITSVFNEYKDKYYDSLSSRERQEVVDIKSDHIDGTMGAMIRNQKLSWLKSSPIDSNECRILTNVRCLSEGVDVPSLDAVMFLSARNSQIDVVQSVGRVMRVAKNKNYGYIIIPVVVPANIEPEKALEDNEKFKVVWTVLNALRAHDDRFNAMINKIDLNKNKPTIGGSILVGGVGVSEDNAEYNKTTGSQLNLPIQDIQVISNAVYARMVQKVGNKRYWEQWAQDVADIATRYIGRITKLIEKDGKHKQAFAKFLEGLQKNINPSIKQEEVIEMLSQHIITKPVFEALFENYSFVKNNPISKSMQKMLDLLEEQALEKDTIILSRFYESVKKRVEGINNADAKQKIIIELYDKFFKTAFPKTVEKLGIVYTPVEIVDFINNSVAKVLKKEFNRTLSDENIHILDPFTGTGTFITRLIQTGLIDKQTLERKYLKELHANEIILLAYYIASINIENAFHDAMALTDKYLPFDGICLTDTFQLGETDEADKLFSDMLPQNSKRVIEQKKSPIRIIIGNPPYSIGQKSANDNAQNQSYSKLENKIESTYAANSNAKLSKGLYDSYIKAFRWSTDRIDKNHGGIIAFVSNAAWLDNQAMDGFRKCLEEEFTSIYIFNLRGNCRTSGELRRKEGGNIFGLGSRTPISITILVKNPKINSKKTQIFYNEVEDYLMREEKLSLASKYHDIFSKDMNLKILKPNKENDWLNQRNDIFNTFISIEPNKKFDMKSKSFFTTYSLGTATNRDAWVYNFSALALKQNIKKTIDHFNKQLELIKKQKIKEPQKNSENGNWTRDWLNKLKKYENIDHNNHEYRKTLYRPFCKINSYFDDDLNQERYQLPKLFPTYEHKNLLICTNGLGATKENSITITNYLVDLNCLSAGAQCFPLYWYEKSEAHQGTLFDQNEDEYIRRDGISDFIWEQCKNIYGHKVTKEDIFYYVYGILHSKDYRTQFANDLKKMLP
ncbi:MAG: type ISP restriction/modification enzyme, partial [Bacteroidaceae bacterium]|nr:type ISP restriction/modification enzyme [Bacteroidaceae bacterium]